MATDIYSLEFEPSQLSHQQEILGLEYSDSDTALELLKKEEKRLLA